MKQRVLARHPGLCIGPHGELLDASGVRLDTLQYGLMKFGSQAACRAIGIELGLLITEQAPEIVYDPSPIVAPFMYKHVPSAAHTIAKYAFIRINWMRAREGLDRIRTRQIYINRQPNADYSRLTLPERLAYMRSSGLELISEPLDGYNLLLLDDVRTTGTYGTLVREMVEAYDIGTMLEVYWATILPEVAAEQPETEHLLNSGAGTGIDLLQRLLDCGPMKHTVRTLKEILKAGTEDFEKLLINLPDEVLLELFEGMVGTGSDLRDMYPDNYDALCGRMEAMLS